MYDIEKEYRKSVDDSVKNEKSSVLRIHVSFGGTSSIYRNAFLTQKIEKDLRNFFESRGIATKLYIPPMKGGGGYDIFEKIYNFVKDIFIHHRLIFTALIRIPFLVKSLRWIFNYLHNLYYRHQIPKTDYRPKIDLNYHFLINDQSLQSNMAVSGVNRAIFEFSYLLPSIKAFIDENYSNFIFSHTLICNAQHENYRLAVSGLDIEVPYQKKLTNALEKMTLEDANTLLTISKTKIGLIKISSTKGVLLF